MSNFRTSASADVTYRATAAGGEDAELRLVMAPAAATVADAWARLSALRPDLDPRTLEIEIRPVAQASPTPARHRERAEQRA